MNPNAYESRDTNISLNIEEEIGNFIDFCRFDKGLSKKTLKAYQLDLEQFSKFLKGHKTFQNDDWKSLPTSVVREFLRSFTNAKPRTINRKIATLKGFWGFMEDEKVIDSNPMDRLKSRFKVPQELPQNLCRTDIEKLFTYLYARQNRPYSGQNKAILKGLRDIVLFEVLFNSGMRVSEVSNLKLNDINLREKVFYVTGKGNKDRLIPICGNEFIKKLVEFLKLSHGSGLANRLEQPVFLNRDGNRLSEQSIRNIVRKYCEDVGLKNITPHVFRHTIATQLLDEGTDIRFIQKFLGHSSITTTTIYASVSDQMQKKMITLRHPRQKLKIAG